MINTIEAIVTANKCYQKFKITVDDTGALSAVEVTTLRSKMKMNGLRPNKKLSHFIWDSI